MFFDIKKAFNGVPHQALLNKLNHVLILILRWLINFTFHAVIKKRSSMGHILHGYQFNLHAARLHLGSLAFLPYLDDLLSTPFSHGVLFADNILLFKFVSSITDYLASQNDVDLVNQWMLKNRLTLSVAKTKFMLITRSRVKSNSCSVFCYLDGLPIERVHKHLGVWLSDDLFWTKHIESTCCKARRLLGYIFRTFSPHCSQDTTIHLYKTQVIPIVEYGCVVWDPHLKIRPNPVGKCARICCQNCHQVMEHFPDNSH